MWDPIIATAYIEQLEHARPSMRHLPQRRPLITQKARHRKLAICTSLTEIEPCPLAITKAIGPAQHSSVSPLHQERIQRGVKPYQLHQVGGPPTSIKLTEVQGQSNQSHGHRVHKALNVRGKTVAPSSRTRDQGKVQTIIIDHVPKSKGIAKVHQLQPRSHSHGNMGSKTLKLGGIRPHQLVGVEPTAVPNHQPDKTLQHPQVHCGRSPFFPENPEKCREQKGPLLALTWQRRVDVRFC